MTMTASGTTQSLALLGGPKAVQADPGDMFTWPIVTREDEEAVLDVLRNRKMSGTDITRQFEAEYAAWQGTKFALAHCNGTNALEAAMFACGVGKGDDIICPSMTYWASGMVARMLGANIIWADIQPDTLCLDPKDVAKRITPRTKLISVVHYAGYPADMDEIMAIANKHGIKVLEDVSHAHGGLYKGRKLGTIGHVAAMSCMSFKSLAIGEGGMLVTNDRLIYERVMAYGHYERHGRQSNDLTIPDIIEFAGVPIGACKSRLNQMASAMGRVQLKHYDQRNAEILKAMNYFWDKIEGTPGVRAHRPARNSGSAMGGWYAAHGLYRSEELGGLPCAKFCEALRAEGFPADPGANEALHLAPLNARVNEVIKKYNLSWCPQTITPAGSLPVSENMANLTFSIPWFKHYRPAIIDEYVAALKKVVAQAGKLK